MFVNDFDVYVFLRHDFFFWLIENLVLDVFHIEQTGLASERANIEILWPIYLFDHLSTFGLKSALIE